MDLKVKHLSFSYGRKEVLHDVSFEAHSGEILSVLGPNGVGKSTLFKCLLGMLKVREGHISADGEELAGMRAPERARRIAYIPQVRENSLSCTVYETILMGTGVHTGLFRLPGKEQRENVERTMDHLGIRHLETQEFDRISGGEQQLVLIARALVQQARILIMDEPSANLDLANRILLQKTIRRLAKEGYTVVLSTHDPQEAYRCSDRILALKEGKVLAYGTPEEMITAEILSEVYGSDLEVLETENGRARVVLPRE